MSVWQRFGRWFDTVFGGDDHPADVDPAKVEAAIRLIQGAVEAEQRTLQVRRLRVSELGADRRSELAQQLAELLKTGKPEVRSEKSEVGSQKSEGEAGASGF